MIVGSAEVVIRAIGDKLEGDIQRALNNAAAKARPAGRRAGQEYGKGMAEGIEAESASFEGKIQKSISGAMDRASKEGAKSVGKNLEDSVSTSGAGTKIGDKLGRDIGNNVAKGMGRSNMRRGFMASILKLGLLVPVVGILVGGISSLASGLFAVGAAAGSASQAMVSGLGAVTALVQGGAVAMIAFKGVGEAIKNGLDPTKAAEFAKSLKSLPKPAQDFVKEFVKLKPVFTDIKKQAQIGLFTELSKSVPRMGKILDVFRDNMRGTGKAVGDAMQSIVRALSSTTALGNLDDVMKSNQGVIRSFGKGIGGLAKGFVALLAAARPLTEGLGKAFANWGEGVGKSLEMKNATGQLTMTLKSANSIFQIIWRSVKNFSAALFAVGKIAKPVGVDLLKSFEGATKRFREFAESGKNSSKIRTFFDNVGENVKKISSMFGELGKAFLRMGANPGLGKTADAIKAIIPNIERALNAGVDLGPKLAKLVGQIADLFTVFQESGALSAVLDIFIAIGKVLVGFAKIPGVGIALQIMAIVFALRMLGRLGGKIGAGIGANFAAMDRTIARTVRTVRAANAPMTTLGNTTGALRQRLITSSTGMLIFGDRMKKMQGAAQTMQRTMGGVYGPVNKLGVAVSGASSAIPIATGRFSKLGGSLKGMGAQFKATGAGGALAGAGLLTAGAAAASSGGAFNKLSGTLTGAGIGTMILPGIGTAAGAAVGGLIDLTREFGGGGRAAKTFAANVTTATKSLNTTTKGALSSVGMTDNIAAWKKAQTQLERLSKQRFDAKIGANTKALDAGIRSAQGNIQKLMASIEKGTNDMDIKINFAQSMSDLGGFMKGFRSTVREIENRTGKKFKFDIDSGPFQQASRDIYTSLKTVGEAAGAAGGTALTDFRAKIASMSGIFGVSGNAATILANKLMGIPDLLHGIKDPEKLNLDADTTKALQKMGLVKEDFARIQAAIAGKPIPLDITANGADAALASLDGVYNKVKMLPPKTQIQVTTDAGVVTTTVGELGDAVNGLPPRADIYVDESGSNEAGINITRTQQILDALGGTTATPTVVGQGVPNFLNLMGTALGSMTNLDGTTAMPGVGANLLPSFGNTVGSAEKGLSGVETPTFAPIGGVIDPTFGGVLGDAKGDLSTYANTPYQAPVSAAIAPGFSFFSFLAKLIPPAPKTIPVKPELDMGAVSGIANKIAGLRPTFPARASLDMGSVSGVANKVAGLRPTFQARAGLDMGSVSGVANRVAGLRPTFPARVSLDMGSVSNAANKVAGLKPTITAQTKANTAGAAKSIAGLKTRTVNIKVSALTGNAKLAIAGISRKAPVIVKVTANVSKAKSDISGIKGKTVSIIVTGRGMSSVQGAIDRIHGKTVTVTTIQRTVKAAAAGGLITGPGSGTSDSIPALLSNGEYVIRAAQVKKYRSILDSINSGAGIQHSLAPILNAANDPGNPVSSLGVASAGGVTRVEGVLSLVDGKAYITGITTEKSESDTAYKNSLNRVGQN